MGSQGYRQTSKKYADVYILNNHYASKDSRLIRCSNGKIKFSSYIYLGCNPITESLLLLSKTGFEVLNKQEPPSQEPKPDPYHPKGQCFSSDPCPPDKCEADPCGYKPPTSGAWVTCCNGQAYPCLNRQRKSPYNGLTDCRIAHEQEHIDDLLGNYGLVKPCKACGFEILRGSKQSECKAYLGQMDCVFDHYKQDCGSLPPKAQKQCKKAYLSEMNTICKYGKFYQCEWVTNQCPPLLPE